MKVSKGFNTDVFMIQLWKHLVRDFRSIEGPDYCVREEVALTRSVKDFRALVWPARCQAPVNLHKQQAQLANLFKRYRFRDDAYTDKELEQRTFEKFSSHQCALSDTNQNVPSSTFLVVQHARRLVKAILGEYSLEEHVDACRFGIKANFGVPASKAYLDVKLTCLTGSDEHDTWFQKHVVKGDSLLESILETGPRVPEYRLPCREHALTMINVPKSWKIKRGIIPDTVLGSFHSNGLGEVVTRRLRTAGLNIRRLQMKHRKLVRTLSKTRSHVTADLSNASNSFTWSLMCRLLPRKWLQVFDEGRSRRYTFNGESYYNCSFMMMGIGYTFPLQTLLFYCLLRAVGDLLGRSRADRVSVYGDDLIYPLAYHRYVVKVFADLGFTMNTDKTYVQDYFRESCGADFYRGADVRPFQPEAEYQVLHRKPYVLFLYKTLNGLLSRWCEFDIPQTTRFCLLEILRAENRIVQVPSEFPDFSGLHLNKVALESYWPVVKPRINPNTWLLEVPRYQLMGRDRVIIHHLPYYWLKLRTVPQQRTGVSGFVLPPESLRWVVLKIQPRNYRSKLSGRRLKLKALVEAEKLVNGAIVYHNR